MTSHPLLYVRVSDAPAMFSIGRSTIYDAGKRGEMGHHTTDSKEAQE